MWGMIHGGLKKKKYKTKFSTSLIKKIEKSYKKTKIIKKKKTGKKTHVEKHYSNPRCFVKKTTLVILNQLNIKKIKSTKIILEKIIKKA
jgi:hypothetical protein